MQIKLDSTTHTLKINQSITYFNKSKDTLHYILLHDWNNAFSDKNSALGKRFIENYSKRFFFAKEKDRGSTQIHNTVVDYKTTSWERFRGAKDLVKIKLLRALIPKDSVSIRISYEVKLPNAKFTSYGFTKTGYELRYWYLIPVVYNHSNWCETHHLNMDNMQSDIMDYYVEFQLPESYYLASNLQVDKNENRWILRADNQKEVQISIAMIDTYKKFETENLQLTTNLNQIELDEVVKKEILERQLVFLERKTDKLNQGKLFINKISYKKNKLYGINQLPSFIRPFSDVFEWDIRMFKVLSHEYLMNIFPIYDDKDKWFLDGVQTYLMMQYVQANYPEVKLVGGLGKIWGFKYYQIAKLDFNERYDFAYQYIVRKNLDQGLQVKSDSLTNFNRKILNPFKAGIALRYLDDYLGGDRVNKAIKHVFQRGESDVVESFKNYLVNNTDQDVSWFFDQYVKSNRKSDYKLKKIKKSEDSLVLRIKNKRLVSYPVSLYGFKQDSLVYKKYFSGIKKSKDLSFANSLADKWVLNYERKLPEINPRDNSIYTKWRLIKKPLKIRLFKDAEDPNSTQLFLEPRGSYNLYDGVILATAVKNRSFFHKNMDVTLIPALSFRNVTLTGSYRFLYHKYLESSKINSYRLGLVGSNYHYNKDLTYKKITPFAQMFFRKKNLRSVKSQSVAVSYTLVDKEIDPLVGTQTEFDNYAVFNASYFFDNPEIINRFSYSADLELGKRFSKLYTEIRFNKLTNYNQQFSMRLFAGAFLHNNSETDFFSFGVNRPNDYLFRYAYFGRNETKGIYSQQIIINDGGFIAQMPVGFANQWLTSLSTSVSLWRWFEIYNNVGFAKNKGVKAFFMHDKGVRLNFVNEIFEVYFPVHSTNGWEITKPHYEERIRFVFKGDFKSIYNFLRRGFL